jgi:hypothetical protein
MFHYQIRAKYFSVNKNRGEALQLMLKTDVYCINIYVRLYICIFI